jgi:REP element-mobilizing transposase RayT
MQQPRGFYSRGYLPHLDAGARSQFLTWRLADSVPAKLIDQWTTELESLPEPERARDLYRRIEKHCDAGHGKSVLRNPICARIVQESLFHDDGIRYSLHAWTVMPNHVHVLLTPVEGVALGTILATLKGVTSTSINRQLSQSGVLWQRDYFDRMIRDEEHFERVRRYIEWNAVKAGLTPDPAKWPWSSANPACWARREQATAERSAD